MTTSQRPTGLVGNRLALAGTVLYLLEWVAIVGSGLVGVPMIGGDPSLPPDQLVAGYVGTEGGMALIAGWMALVLTGRVLLVVGVRAALRDSGRPSPLLDLAVALFGSTPLLMWVWAFWTGAVLWRRASRRPAHVDPVLAPYGSADPRRP